MSINITNREEAMEYLARTLSSTDMSMDEAIRLMSNKGVTVDAAFVQQADAEARAGTYAPKAKTREAIQAHEDLEIAISEDVHNIMNQPVTYTDEEHAAMRKQRMMQHAAQQDTYEATITREYMAAMASGDSDYAGQLAREMRLEGVDIPEYNEE